MSANSPMPLSHHEITPRAAQAVAATWLRSALHGLTAAWSMDQLARLSVLEGAAGKSPGTWLRHRERGFGIALEHFGPKLQAAWTARKDQGVYDKAVATATKALRTTRSMEPMDLVQNLTLNSTNPSGSDRTRIFHSIGKKLQSHSNDLAQGNIGPTDWRVINGINSWVNNAARDEMRSFHERRLLPVKDTSALPIKRAPEMTQDTREALMLMALQSPGGPGLEMRRIIDRLIDQKFRPPERPIVRSFLWKIGHPKFRSAQEMRRLVSNFRPDRWFRQALNLVRREIAEELGVSSQQMTNALGGGAKKIFRFMRQDVAKDPRVRGIINDLANEIELTEPGSRRLSSRRRAGEDDDREAELTEEQTPEMPYTSVREWFEKDEFKDWDLQSRPGVHFERGPRELRVAARWLLGKSPGGSEFMQAVRGKRYRHPETGNRVLFRSLPSREQRRIYQQWVRGRQRAETVRQQQQPQQQQPQQPQQPERRPEGEPGAEKPERDLKPTRPWKWGEIDRSAHVDEDSQTFGFARVRDHARVEGSSKINATVEGKAIVRSGRVDRGAVVRGNAIIEHGEVTDGALVEGNARLRDQARVSGRDTVVSGRTDVSRASVVGGNWDGQKLTKSGEWGDSYDQETVDTLERGFADGPDSHGALGDLPVRLMAAYLREGGKTQGFFGGDVGRKRLLKRVRKTMERSTDPSTTSWQADTALRRMGDVDDKTWKVVMEHAEEQARRKRPKSKRAHLLAELARTARTVPSTRPAILGLLRAGRTAGATGLRGRVIRAAFDSMDPRLRAALLETVLQADRRSARPRTAAMTRTARYRPAFLRWVEGRTFRNPDTENDVQFESLPGEEKKAIYARWQQDRRAWAEQYKPEGLDSATRLTEDKFDQLEKGDNLWLSWSPVALHRIVGIDRSGPRSRNPILQMVQIDPETGAEGESRHMHRSTLRNQEMEAHRVPGESPSAQRERKTRERQTQQRERRQRSRGRLPKQPEGGWPDFRGFPPLRHGEDESKIADLFQEIAGGPLRGVSFAGVDRKVAETLGRQDPRVTRQMLVELGSWADELARVASERRMQPEYRVFRAVRLKMDEGIRKADQKIEERSRKVQSLVRNRPGTTGMLSELRGALPDAKREKFNEGLRDALTYGWADDGVDGLRELGAKHFRDRFTEGVLHDMLVTGWNARASWLDEDGVRDIREALIPVREAVAQGQAGRPAPVRTEERRREPEQEGSRGDRRRAPARSRREEPENAPRTERPREEPEQRSEPEPPPESSPEPEQEERREPTGRHRGRTELRGKPQQGVTGSTRVRPIPTLIALAAPSSMSRELREEMHRKMRDLTVDGAKELFERFNVALRDPEGAYMTGLKGNGYTEEGLRKLRRALKAHLGPFVGRRYGGPVLEIANRHDLEAEDADALHEFRSRKPGRGAKLSNAQIFERFLAKAKPETRERMRGMPLADFMAMYKAIMADDEEDEIL